MNSQALCGMYEKYTLQGVFYLLKSTLLLLAGFYGGKAMSNEENIPVLTKTDLITLLQNMDDHVILTINLEGDAEDGEA